MPTHTDEDKKHQREKLKIVTDDLHMFMELMSDNKLQLNQQKLDLIELRLKREEQDRLKQTKTSREERLREESDIDFIDCDYTEY